MKHSHVSFSKPLIIDNCSASKWAVPDECRDYQPRAWQQGNTCMQVYLALQNSPIHMYITINRWTALKQLIMGPGWFVLEFLDHNHLEMLQAGQNERQGEDKLLSLRNMISCTFFPGGKQKDSQGCYSHLSELNKTEVAQSQVKQIKPHYENIHPVKQILALDWSINKDKWVMGDLQQMIWIVTDDRNEQNQEQLQNWDETEISVGAVLSPRHKRKWLSAMC